MATEFGYMIREHNKKHSDHAANLVTRDLLGKSFAPSTSEVDNSHVLDLDLQVPAGWEKRLDLKSGKVYLQKCSTSSEPIHSTNYYTIKRPLKIMEETGLDLQLESNLTTKTTNYNSSCSYESVCTLDKVRSALDRANNEQLRKMFLPRLSKSPSMTSTSSKVTLELEGDDNEDERKSSISHQHEGLLIVVGCPNCLMYVMISTENPKCPKCNLIVALPMTKKPRIDVDLNISI